MRKFSVEAKRGRFHIHAAIQEVGKDLLVALWGGTRPHIGAVGMAVPRPSLSDPKKWSATSSVHTFVGHKEDMIVKRVSEILAGRLRKSVVVTAGLHWETMTSREIKGVQQLCLRMTGRILKELEKKE